MLRVKTTSNDRPTARSWHPSPAPRNAGFSFVELLMAAAILAITVTVAVIAYSTIASGGRRAGGGLAVTLPSGVAVNFYGITNSVVAVSAAPAYGETVRAEGMRNLLDTDLARSVAVFCLARNDISTVRPSTVTLGVNFDPRTNASPAGFRTLLGTGASTFTDYPGSANSLTNTSLFILQASTNSTSAKVLATYEADFVRTTSPVGTYASVRRYEGATLTYYYHVFYEGTNAHNFLPPVAYFERSVAPATSTNAIDRNRQAAGIPFYFLWWPDPAVVRLHETNSAMPSVATNLPRAGYSQMADRTSLFFVIPAYPAL